MVINTRSTSDTDAINNLLAEDRSEKNDDQIEFDYERIY